MKFLQLTRSDSPHTLRNNNSPLEALFHGSNELSRAGWPSQLRAETQQVLLWPEENDTRFLIFPQVFFSKKHAFYTRSLMSKGTCMVRPRAWRLVSSRKHWSAAPTASTQQPERSPSSPAARASESVMNQAVRSSVTRGKLCRLRRERFQSAGSCSRDLSQIQLLQLLICHEELRLLVKADKEAANLTTRTY